jgi:hypothetical protein
MLVRYKTMFVRSGQCWPITRQCLSGVVNVGLTRQCLSEAVNVGSLQDNVCQEWSMLARYKNAFKVIVESLHKGIYLQWNSIGSRNFPQRFSMYTVKCLVEKNR